MPYAMYTCLCAGKATGICRCSCRPPLLRELNARNACSVRTIHYTSAVRGLQDHKRKTKDSGLRVLKEVDHDSRRIRCHSVLCFPFSFHFFSKNKGKTDGLTRKRHDYRRISDPAMENGAHKLSSEIDRTSTDQPINIVLAPS